MQLETDLFTAEILTNSGLREALEQLHPKANTRAILSRDANTYIQAGAYDNGFVIEKRSGDEASHVHARHTFRDAPLDAPVPEKRGWLQRLLNTHVGAGPHDHAFSQEEVADVFVAYFEGSPDPDFVTWHPGYA
ncbi:MAG: hypothetical protein AAFQ13_11405 [Pseudomonadota bacterium]